jgi:hypothetical protein
MPAGSPVRKNLRAQHGTAKVNGRQQHGLAGLEEARERDRAARFVAENRIERHLLVEFLVDSHAQKLAGKRRLQVGILHGQRGLHRGRLAGLRERGGTEESNQGK